MSNLPVLIVSTLRLYEERHSFLYSLSLSPTVRAMRVWHTTLVTLCWHPAPFLWQLQANWRLCGRLRLCHPWSAGPVRGQPGRALAKMVPQPSDQTGPVVLGWGRRRLLQQSGWGCLHCTEDEGRCVNNNSNNNNNREFREHFWRLKVLYDVKKNLSAQIPSKWMVYKRASKTYRLKRKI